MIVRHTEATHVGWVRDHNEDAIGVPTAFSLRESRGHLFAVADGLGGHDGGEIASRIAIDTLFSTYYESDRDPQQSLVYAVVIADERVTAAGDTAIREAGDTPHARGHRMGTTLIAVVVTEGKIIGANVGDSRAYLLHEGRLRRLSNDQSLVAEQVRQGRITEEQAKHLQFRNVLLQCLGHGAIIQPERFEAPFGSGDVLLLCSDGLHGVVGDATIELLLTTSPPTTVAKALIEAANAAGRPDNISVVIAWVENAAGATT